MLIFPSLQHLSLLAVMTLSTVRSRQRNKASSCPPARSSIARRHLERTTLADIPNWKIPNQSDKNRDAFHHPQGCTFQTRRPGAVLPHARGPDLASTTSEPPTAQSRFFQSRLDHWVREKPSDLRGPPARIPLPVAEGCAREPRAPPLARGAPQHLEEDAIDDERSRITRPPTPATMPSSVTRVDLAPRAPARRGGSPTIAIADTVAVVHFIVFCVIIA
jgi:hypothetical protein